MQIIAHSSILMKLKISQTVFLFMLERMKRAIGLFQQRSVLELGE